MGINRCISREIGSFCSSLKELFDAFSGQISPLPSVSPEILAKAGYFYIISHSFLVIVVICWLDKGTLDSIRE